jgi:hypothetical protein
VERGAAAASWSWSGEKRAELVDPSLYVPTQVRFGGAPKTHELWSESELIVGRYSQLTQLTWTKCRRRSVISQRTTISFLEWARAPDPGPRPAEAFTLVDLISKLNVIGDISCGCRVPQLYLTFRRRNFLRTVPLSHCSWMSVRHRCAAAVIGRTAQVAASVACLARTESGGCVDHGGNAQQHWEGVEGCK